MASPIFRLRQQYWRLAAPGKIRRYIDRHDLRKLQIGANANLLPGWLNTTLYPFTPGTVYLDASLPFPIPDASFDAIFAEHVIEHLEFELAALMLRESHRILRGGGRIRLATPDLAQIMRLYTQPDEPEPQRYIRFIMDRFRPQIGEYNPAHVINQSFHGWRHRFVYDEATLRVALKRAGFVKIRRCQPGESDHDSLRGLERHGQVIGNEWAMRYETMALEAEKAHQP